MLVHLICRVSPHKLPITSLQWQTFPQFLLLDHRRTEGQSASSFSSFKRFHLPPWTFILPFSPFLFPLILNGLCISKDEKKTTTSPHLEKKKMFSLARDIDLKKKKEVRIRFLFHLLSYPSCLSSWASKKEKSLRDRRGLSDPWAVEPCILWSKGRIISGWGTLFPYVRHSQSTVSRKIFDFKISWFPKPPVLWRWAQKQMVLRGFCLGVVSLLVLSCALLRLWWIVRCCFGMFMFLCWIQES